MLVFIGDTGRGFGVENGGIVGDQNQYSQRSRALGTNGSLQVNGSSQNVNGSSRNGPGQIPSSPCKSYSIINL